MSLTRSAPPSPQVKFFVSWKLCVASAPNVPSGRPRAGSEEPVGVVLDDRDAARPRDLEDRVHLAADAGVVHGDDRARLRGAIESPRAGFSSRFSVSGRMSANTGRAPRRTNAFAVETNVKAGTITSSPGSMSSRRAAISSACVHEVVRRAAGDAELLAEKLLSTGA